MLVDKLTAVQRTGLIRVHFIGGERIDVDTETLTTYKLHAGAEVSETIFITLQEKAAYLYWMRRCLYKLARRPQSQTELMRFMRQNKVSETVQQQVVSRLQQRSYINDEQFADWYVKAALQKRKSLRMIRYELNQKGIPQSLIQSVVATVSDGDHEQLRVLIEKKRKIARYQDNIVLMRFLIRKGFAYEDVKRALNTKGEIAD